MDARLRRRCQATASTLAAEQKADTLEGISTRGTDRPEMAPADVALASQSHSRFALRSARSGHLRSPTAKRSYLRSVRRVFCVMSLRKSVVAARVAEVDLRGQGGTLASATDGSNQAGEAREDSGAVIGGCAA